MGWKQWCSCNCIVTVSVEVVVCFGYRDLKVENLLLDDKMDIRIIGE